MQSAAYLAAIGAMLAAVKADSGVGQPGYCKDDSSCEDNYVCISVQTTRSGIENVKQCLPYKTQGDVCSGTFSGLCPSFSTWKTAFQSISSVCAYQLPSGSDKCLKDKESGSTDGYVSCVTITETVKTKTKNFGVIYGCVDFDGSNLLYLKDSDNWDLSAQMNYSAVINEGCVNPNNGENSDVVCSGRGTCSPRSSGGIDFACRCNVGYNGTYCQKIVSNKCTLESQCQAGTCNLKTQECECDPGTTGDQCAYCDPTSPKACGGHGKCIAASSKSSGSLAAAGSTADMKSGSMADMKTGTNSDMKTGTSSDMKTGTNSDMKTGTNSDLTAGSTKPDQADNAGDNAGQVADVDSSAVSTDNTNSDTSTRFLMEMADVTLSSSSESMNICECESGYTGDQCTRKVESDSKGSSSKPKEGKSSDAASVATSFVLVASVFVVAFLN
ncbi:unnamed protein product [Peronospora farinosa]|uniref:EGF-like domain-containing protein n=1 Tax=Peronospora farinosa TaxID=134698 RepID=A0AAV0UW04_9STRA|nr:unnamed protein product [Peronospora farinosa]CAI5739521.1 unnamed protein product [Peronospora farinosa]